MALIARFIFSRAVFSSGSATATAAAGSGSGSGESKLPWMPEAGSLDAEVEPVAEDRLAPVLGSIAVFGVVVMVAAGASLILLGAAFGLLVAEAVPVLDLVFVRLGAFFSRNPSMNSIPIHRKM